MRLAHDTEAEGQQPKRHTLPKKLEAQTATPLLSFAQLQSVPTAKTYEGGIEAAGPRLRKGLDTGSPNGAAVPGQSTLAQHRVQIEREQV